MTIVQIIKNPKNHGYGVDFIAQKCVAEEYRNSTMERPLKKTGMLLTEEEGKRNYDHTT